MKKIALFLVFLIVAMTAFSGVKKWQGYTVATASDKFGVNMIIGDHVYCTATGNEYVLTANQGYTSTVTTLVASGHYTLLTTYSATPTLTTLTVTGNAKALRLAATDSTAGLKIRGAANQYYKLTMTASGTLTVTTTTTP